MKEVHAENESKPNDQALLVIGVVSVSISVSSSLAQTASTRTFAVSGDSRNCGDVVMPEIAQRVRADQATFYWHLGDFRAFYDFDQDLLASRHGKLGVSEYESHAWQDFIDQELAPFGPVPVFLAPGPDVFSRYGTTAVRECFATEWLQRA